MAQLFILCIFVATLINDPVSHCYTASHCMICLNDVVVLHRYNSDGKNTYFLKRD